MKRINIDEINKWTDSWAGFKDDIEYSQKLIQLTKPFIEELLQEKYSYKTIKNHKVLGGYLIKKTNDDKKKIHLLPYLLLARYIDSVDGSLIQDFSKYKQKNFDRTCRIFYKYLVEKVLSKL